MTSRKYDWQKCRARQDQERNIKKLCWKVNNGKKAGFTLVTYTSNGIVKVVGRYGLPEIDNWDAELKELAKWIKKKRILSIKEGRKLWKDHNFLYFVREEFPD